MQHKVIFNFTQYNITCLIIYYKKTKKKIMFDRKTLTLEFDQKKILNFID